MKLIVTGDVNLLNVDDPAAPLAKVAEEFRASDMVFSNLECCLYTPPIAQSAHKEGFYANPEIGGQVLQLAGIRAVGIANNVNYGDEAILASIAKLDDLGIPHTGAGANIGEARKPAILSTGGKTFGFLQRSSIFWPRNHEALEDGPGIAVLHAHTAYHVPMHENHPSFNRPGIPPKIITWADPGYLEEMKSDVRALRAKVDIVVASFHWGLRQEVLAYMREIAHAAIDAGADLVMGHGPHYYLDIEVYRGKPIFYGLGSFSFHTGHQARVHGNWIGLMVRALIVNGNAIEEASVQFVRHNGHNESVLCRLADEPEALADLTHRSKGVALTPRGDELLLGLSQIGLDRLR